MLGVTKVSQNFIFDDEILINDDRQSVNGYLWAVDYLVDKLPSSQAMDNINFYAIYNVLNGDVKVRSDFYVPDESFRFGERHEVVDVDITAQEKTELIDALQSYCKTRYSQTCLEFVNEIRKEENLPVINDSLNNIIDKADALKVDCVDSTQNYIIKDER